MTLEVDGAQMKVTTMKSRVLDIVQESGFSVADRDDLFPAGDQTVRDAQTIVLRRGRPLQISLDGRVTEQQWTTAATVDGALAQLKMTDTAPVAANRAARVPLGGMALPSAAWAGLAAMPSGWRAPLPCCVPILRSLCR